VVERISVFGWQLEPVRRDTEDVAATENEQVRSDTEKEQVWSYNEQVRSYNEYVAATEYASENPLGDNLIEIEMEPLEPPGERVTDDLASTEAWLDSLGSDQANPAVDNTDDLRVIAETTDELARVQARLTEAIQIARAHGRSWTEISMRLGVTRQAARQRYAGDSVAAK
jgi:hypothetical protein